jgi:hypothetical protein
MMQENTPSPVFETRDHFVRSAADSLTVSFGSDGNAAPFCTFGWSEPEPGETWSVGPQCMLELPVATPGPHALILRLRPHVNGERLQAQRLGLIVNGVRFVTFTLEGPTTRACIIPGDIIGNRSKVKLLFETPGAVSPEHIDGSPDRRPLAVAFSQAVLRPVMREPDISDQAGADVESNSQAEAMGFADIMLQFESLGENCEFGLVQRHYQAEPLGLFRFSSTPLPKLLLALEQQLDGLGERGSLTVGVSSSGHELMVEDQRFGFLYHAWVKTGEQTIEAVQDRELKRLPFLKRKLLQDMELGEKIFVFHAMRSIPEDEVFPLAAILQCYGPNTLLFVTLADHDHATGTVDIRSAGFLVGYLDRFAPPEDAIDASFEAWANICRQAYRIHRSPGQARED